MSTPTTISIQERPGIAFGINLHIAAWCALVAALYFMTAVACRFLALGVHQQPAFLPAAGVSVAAAILVRAPRDQWMTLVSIGVAAFAWGLWEYSQVSIGAVLAVIAVLGAAIARIIMRYLSPDDPHARTFRGVASLVLPVAFISAAAVSAAGTLAVWALPIYEIRPDPVRVWTGRVLGELLGILLVTPLALWLPAPGREPRHGWRRVEGAAVFIAAGLGAYVIFNVAPLSSGVALALLCLPIPLLVLAATRLGPAGTAGTGLIIAVLAVWFTNAGRGPIAALAPPGRDQVLGVQAYLVLLVSSNLLLAGAVIDWRRTDRLRKISEGKYRDFVAQSSEGVWRIEVSEPVPVTLSPEEQIEHFYRHARLDECNDAMAKMYGLEHASQLVGIKLDQLMVRSDPRNDAYLRAFIASGYRLENAESHETDMAGNDKYFLNSLVGTVVNGRISRAWGTQRDITAKKAADEALARTQERLHTAMDATGMGAWTFDAVTDEVTIDESVRRLGAFPADTPLRAPRDHYLSLLEASQRAVIEAALANAIQGGDVFRVEFKVPLADGAYRWLNARGTTHRGQSGRPLSITGVCFDVTETHTAAEERERLHAQLLHSQKLESLGVMAGGIAHDFNNLLVGMLGNAALGLKQISADSPASATLANIEQAARRASDLTRQLLAYAGKGRSMKGPLDLSRLVADMLPLLRSMAPANVTLRTEFGKGLAAAFADATQLEQVVMNLVTNACEATVEGHGDVLIRTREMYATTEQLADGFLACEEHPGRYVVVEVADNGSGIDTDSLERIFDPFYSTKFTGRGLGLAVVLGIIRAHHGAIKVTPREGGGTVFSAMLPVSPHAAPVSTLEVKPAATQSGGVGRVLVVDDEAIVRDVTAKLLQREGWEVVTVASGPEALQTLNGAARGGRFDAMILDATMPGMSGMEVLREVKRINPDLPVLLSSGFTQEALDKPSQPKPDGFLQKPFTGETLIRALIDAIAGHGQVG